MSPNFQNNEDSIGPDSNMTPYALLSTRQDPVTESIKKIIEFANKISYFSAVSPFTLIFYPFKKIFIFLAGPYRTTIFITRRLDRIDVAQNRAPIRYR